MKLSAIQCPAAALPVIVVLPPQTPVSSILRAARDLISVPERWAKDFYGYTEPFEEDRYVKLADTYEQSVCFCSIGAVSAILGAKHEMGSLHGLVNLMLAPGLPEEAKRWGNVGMYNDTPETTHADVLRMFNRAIRHAEAREALQVLQ